MLFGVCWICFIEIRDDVSVPMSSVDCRSLGVMRNLG